MQLIRALGFTARIVYILGGFRLSGYNFVAVGLVKGCRLNCLGFRFEFRSLSYGFPVPSMIA